MYTCRGHRCRPEYVLLAKGAVFSECSRRAQGFHDRRKAVIIVMVVPDGSPSSRSTDGGAVQVVNRNTPRLQASPRAPEIIVRAAQLSSSTSTLSVADPTSSTSDCRLLSPHPQGKSRVHKGKTNGSPQIDERSCGERVYFIAITNVSRTNRFRLVIRLTRRDADVDLEYQLESQFAVRGSAARQRVDNTFISARTELPLAASDFSTSRSWIPRWPWAAIARALDGHTPGDAGTLEGPIHGMERSRTT